MSEHEFIPPDAQDDTGGWLGADQRTTSPPRSGDRWSSEAETATAPFRGTRRFSERELVAPSGGRRGGLVAVLVGVAVIAIASASLLLLRARDPGTTPAPAATGPTTFITPHPQGAPTKVTLTDNGTAVTVTWADPTAVARVARVVDAGEVHRRGGGIDEDRADPYGNCRRPSGTENT